MCAVALSVMYERLWLSGQTVAGPAVLQPSVSSNTLALATAEPNLSMLRIPQM